jgi:hypothetical protein
MTASLFPDTEFERRRSLEHLYREATRKARCARAARDPKVEAYWTAEAKRLWTRLQGRAADLFTPTDQETRT